MYVPTSIGDFGPIVCILNMCLHVRQHVPFSLLVRSQKYVLTCTRDSGLPYFKAQNSCLVHCQYMSSLYTRDFGPPYRRLSEDVRAQVPVVVVVCLFVCLCDSSASLLILLDLVRKRSQEGTGNIFVGDICIEAHFQLL